MQLFEQERVAKWCYPGIHKTMFRHQRTKIRHASPTNVSGRASDGDGHASLLFLVVFRRTLLFSRSGVAMRPVMSRITCCLVG